MAIVAAEYRPNRIVAVPPIIDNLEETGRTKLVQSFEKRRKRIR